MLLSVMPTNKNMVLGWSRMMPVFSKALTKNAYIYSSAIRVRKSFAKRTSDEVHSSENGLKQGQRPFSFSLAYS